MTDAEKELFAQATAEYRQALIGAAHVWKEARPAETAPPDVLQSAAATILIHMKDLRRNGSAPVAAKRDGALPEAASQAPAAVPPSIPTACPECGGEMWDNRADKRTPKSPDFRCKDKDCNHPVWLTPPKGGRSRATAGAR